jgi:hypothetical protein
MKILRIDDYPTGIRPIQPGQLDMFDRMLAELPPFHLGVVPATYSLVNHSFYSPNAIICQHGCEHGYTEKSKLLVNDPYNHGTVGVFDEFEGMDDESIATELVLSKSFLMDEFDCYIDTFIPCCNVIDTRLAKLIAEAGFTRILCENVVPSPIPIIKSDFYGKLEDLKGKPDVVTLHITWEWDTVRERGFEYWKNLVHEKL